MEFGKAVLMEMVHYSTRTQVKGGQGERRAGLSPGDAGLGALVVPSQQSCVSSTRLSVCDNRLRGWPSREAPSVLVCPGH